MATPVLPRFRTYEEYLAFERSAEGKHEYAGGEVYAMSGARRAHNRIAANLIAELSTALRTTPCTVYTSDQRVRAADDTAHYPDVSALCGEPMFSDEVEDELLNPSLVIEVLSKGTAAYDRGEKFEHYATLPSLREYVLASSEKARLEHFVRESDGWKLRAYGPGDRVKLASLPCELEVDEVYRKVFGP